MTEPMTKPSGDELLSAVESGLQVYDLGRPLFDGVPKAENRLSFVTSYRGAMVTRSVPMAHRGRTI